MTTTTDTSRTAIMLDEIKALLTDGQQPSASQSLSDLGMTSLAAVTLQYRLSSRHGINVTLEKLMGPQPISQIAQI